MFLKYRNQARTTSRPLGLEDGGSKDVERCVSCEVGKNDAVVAWYCCTHAPDPKWDNSDKVSRVCLIACGPVRTGAHTDCLRLLWPAQRTWAPTVSPAEESGEARNMWTSRTK